MEEGGVGGGMKNWKVQMEGGAEHSVVRIKIVE